MPRRHRYPGGQTTHSARRKNENFVSDIEHQYNDGAWTRIGQLDHLAPHTEGKRAFGRIHPCD